MPLQPTCDLANNCFSAFTFTVLFEQLNDHMLDSITSFSKSVINCHIVSSITFT